MDAQIDIFEEINRPMHELSIEEAAPYFDRIVKTPAVSFEQFCMDKGEPGIQDKALNGMCAQLFFSCTRMSTSDHKKVVQGRNALARLEEFKMEYSQLIASNEIKVKVEKVPLNLNKISDYSRAKMCLRRVVQRAIRKGEWVPRANLWLMELRK